MRNGGMSDDPIVAEFVVESLEHLADIENQLLSIEANSESLDVELVNTVFRAVHSIKGAAGFLGFSTMGDLAHALENVLNLIREGELVPDGHSTDVMLRAADTLRNMFDDVEASNEVDIAEHVRELQAIASEGLGRPSIEIEDTSDKEASSDPNQSAQPSDAPSPTGSTASESAEQSHQATNTEPASRQVRRPASAPVETTIRVPVRHLDRLMNLAGELVLARNQLVQTVYAERHASLSSVAATVDQVTSELQEAIMQTRMQVVGTVLGKFPRVVRDLSRQLGKECRLIIHGSEVELDKSIIEAIGDPLTHLIRNAVDHGIESPAQREQAGKPAEGTIVLSAFHQAGKVNITIEDDGAGIDPQKLREKAVARGIVTSEQANEMSDREALRLIFHPGFSTAEKVTEVSGRGVGMDVVRTNIEKLGGTVDVDSVLGKGTTIRVKLPLTLAIVPSLIVHCGNQCFAIPQTNIRELVRIKHVGRGGNDRIERVQGAEVYRLRGRLLPVVRLRSVLGMDSPDDPDPVAEGHMVVLEAGPFHFGLMVDRLRDSEEIVVKPLGRHMKDCRILAGATILGDGQVALILDVAGVASQSNLSMPKSERHLSEEPDAAFSCRDAHASLLFRNHPDEQFGVPLDMISRLERIRVDQIDSVGGVEVLQYRGSSIPLLSVERFIRASAREDTPRVHVAVFSVLGRELGLIVPHLQDIRCIDMLVDTATFSEPGVIGCVEVEGKATRLLDLYQLTELAFPEWFSEADEAIQPQDDFGAPLRIVIAEDSAFFRRQLSRYFTKAGLVVHDFEDGQSAWRYLQDNGEDVDVVVTDIEMPKMDGRELASRIKDDPDLQRIPVIAVTSLAGESDRQLGLQSGIDEYQIKLDRENLMASVRRLTRACSDRSAPKQGVSH